MQLLLGQRLAANQEASTQVMPGAHLAQLIEDLQGQLTCGRHNESSQPIKSAPAQPVELLNHLGEPHI